MITVHELIGILKNCDKSAVVIFQQMAGVPMPITRVEGDNVAYNECDDVVLNIELTPALIAQGYYYDEVDDGTGIKCVVLWSDR